MDRKIIAPYVKESRLPDLETSIRIADQALLYFKSVERQCQGKVTPGACVALAFAATAAARAAMKAFSKGR